MPLLLGIHEDHGGAHPGAVGYRHSGAAQGGFSQTDTHEGGVGRGPHDCQSPRGEICSLGESSPSVAWIHSHHCTKMTARDDFPISQEKAFYEENSYKTESWFKSVIVVAPSLPQMAFSMPMFLRFCFSLSASVSFEQRSLMTWSMESID
ncbi:hypothetical protein Ccrd_015037 [Cynara cardunculus var. scolymus]|uniref:Uncharacterized protein n=1 Tax=Cynara cardunculus var. scolymus TaxID=59895 RepID=A0A103YCL9_CYNCS|nr:hypothetical protein Ccrd_015037 [Cynara cardunculus var. scolymus]